jgi:hypothetical protein
LPCGTPAALGKLCSAFGGLQFGVLADDDGSVDLSLMLQGAANSSVTDGKDATFTGAEHGDVLDG